MICGFGKWAARPSARKAEPIQVEASRINEYTQTTGVGHAKPPPDNYQGPACAVQEGKLQTKLEAREYPDAKNAIIKNHHR